eukprot:TRINITY_DN2924_c4_g1_i1.p1 TRINITY_DN2924_c4_g1~~TRINITY_DN2924_c4_g1_i1.p1  ORF type:complete len:421 (+),score=66.83 TRINITY_DN2924_c4_g1_i1:85-1347(+)
MSCLACAECGQAVVTACSLIAECQVSTLQQAVYAYELTVLGRPITCYSVTSRTGERFDIVLAAEVCIHNSAGRGNSLQRGAAWRGKRRAAGILALDDAPKAEHSWFPGFTWQGIGCGGCESTQLLGWAFAKDTAVGCNDQNGKQSSGFFALVVTRLRERALAWSPGHCQMRGQIELDPAQLRPEPMDDSGVVFSQHPTHRGLRADELCRSSGPGAAAAARGLASMPWQLLPSSTLASHGKTVKGLASIGMDDCGISSGSSSDESEDFARLRRQVRKERQGDCWSRQQFPGASSGCRQQKIAQNMRMNASRGLQLSNVSVSRSLGLSALSQSTNTKTKGSQALSAVPGDAALKAAGRGRGRGGTRGQGRGRGAAPLSATERGTGSGTGRGAAILAGAEALGNGAVRDELPPLSARPFSRAG